MAMRRVPRKQVPKPRRPARGDHQVVVTTILGTPESGGAGESFDSAAFDVDAFDADAFDGVDV